MEITAQEIPKLTKKKLQCIHVLFLNRDPRFPYQRGPRRILHGYTFWFNKYRYIIYEQFHFSWFREQVKREQI